MTFGNHTASFVEDNDDDFVVIDEASYGEELIDDVVIEKKYGDKFSKVVKTEGQSKPLQNRIYRRRASLEKSKGASGVESKAIDPNEMLNGYGLFDLVEPPYNLELLASLFEENAVHNACVMARTMNTVGLGYVWVNTPKASRRIELANQKDDEKALNRINTQLQNEEVKLDEILDNMNTDESFTETLIKIWVDVLTTGNGYMEIGRNMNGSIGYIGHIPSVDMRVRRKRDGFVQSAGNKYIFFRNFQEKNKDPINNDPRPNEVIHFKMYTPTNRYYGVPAAISALSAIIGDKFAKAFNIDYFENKAVPRYALILQGAKLSQKSKNAIKNFFKNEIKGKNHGTLFLPIPASMGKDVKVDFKPLENTVQEGSFDKYRKSNRDEIAVAHRVPLPKIGVYDNANLAVSRDADKTFKTQVIGPDQRVVEKKINRIITEFSSLKRLKFDEIDLIDDDIKSRIHDRYLRLKVLTPNEVRRRIGETSIDGGDETLPYPTEVKRRELEFKSGRDFVTGDKLFEDEEQTQDFAGSKDENNNALSGSPPKSSQDSVDGESSNADETTGRADRGASDEEGGM